ncbi:MAG TPA: hypothetical protein VLI69_02000 [Gammaproteobacteria bacterium]|nr:hypothetical protein [Gammaproteobacteria bacterium]
MKLFTTALFALVFLSGCAYIQGRKDQQQAVPQETQKGKVVQMQEPVPPAQNTSPNPSTTASKMLTPITQ